MRAFRPYRKPAPVVPPVASDRLMFAATRLVIATLANPAVVAGFEVQYSKILVGTPDYPINTLWLYFPNWRRQQNAGTPTEVSPGNANTVRARLQVGGAIYPIDFAGSTAASVIADGGGLWCSVQAEVPANSTIFVRTESQVPVGGVRIGIGKPYTNIGEGIQHLAAVDEGYMDGTKDPSTIGASGNIYAYGPTMMVAKGWDGRAVVLGIGDSILFGNDDNAVNNRSFDPRGNMGYVQRGLDSLTGGRIAFGMIAVPGILSTLTDTAGEIPKTIAMLKDPIFGAGAAYLAPFTHKVSEMGVNNFDTSTGASRYPTPVKTDLQNYIAFLNAQWPDQPLLQTTLTPRCNSTALYNWTDPLQQTPVGTDATAPNGRWANNDDIRAGSIPGIAGFIDAEPYASDAVYRDRWAPGAYSTTLSAAVAAGASSISLPIQLPVGENACIDPGVVGAENRSVLAVSGSGPYVHTLSAALTNAHSSGAAVKTRKTTDGVHLNTTASIAVSQAVIDAKLAGKFAV